MGRVNNYLLKSFSSIFSSLFFILFFIASIVFFIKIAIITSIIKITFSELGLLYIYLLPHILIYTMPITFFIALCISLFNLSKENETIVLFTLGYVPNKIAKLFIIVALFMSSLLVVNILVLIPRAKQLNANFIDYKKAEAKFNIKATEFGQKFSKWLVYIDKSNKKNSYSNIVMYQQENNTNKEKIIIATNANLKNKNAVLKLELNNGKAFEISDKKIEQVDFLKLYLISRPKERVMGVTDIVSYWLEALKHKKREKDLAFFLLIALFPLASVLFALSIGIVTFRYDRVNVNLSITAVIILYMLPGVILVQYIGINAVLVMFLSTIILSYAMYKKKILSRY